MFSRTTQKGASKKSERQAKSAAEVGTNFTEKAEFCNSFVAFTLPLP
jgi:hypothetical protein